MQGQTVLIIQALVLLQAILLLAPASVTSQALKRSVFIKDSEYRDFIPLTAANFTDIALRDEQSWVIHVHDEFLDPEVKMTATQYRGLIRFGLISVKDTKAVEMMKFDPSKHFFRALPFGWESRKKSKFLDTEGFLNALEFASASVPVDLVSIVRSENDTKSVLTEAIASKPSRFTVLFTAKEDQPTLLQRVLSRKLIRNFNFALLPNADTKSAFKDAGLGSLAVPVPGMAVLMVSQTGTVRSTRMTDSGNLLYPEALRFLIEFNRQFRPELPGDARSSDRQVLYMRDILDAERLIFDVDDAADESLEVEKSRDNDGAEEADSETTGEDLREEL